MASGNHHMIVSGHLAWGLRGTRIPRVETRGSPRGELPFREPDRHVWSTSVPLAAPFISAFGETAPAGERSVTSEKGGANTVTTVSSSCFRALFCGQSVASNKGGASTAPTVSPSCCLVSELRKLPFVAYPLGTQKGANDRGAYGDFIQIEGKSANRLSCFRFLGSSSFQFRLGAGRQREERH